MLNFGAAKPRVKGMDPGPPGSAPAPTIDTLELSTVAEL